MIPLSLQSRVSECSKCDLRKGCKSVVVGSGSLSSDIMLVGDSPGYDDDLLGRPFTGRSGQLLTKILANAGIDRESVYLTYAVKCKTPLSRAPNKGEIAECKSWLWEELKALQPRIIVTLGKVPTCLLLKLPQAISLGKYAGKPHKMSYLPPDTTIYPWYDPSFLLKKGSAFDKSSVQFFRELNHVRTFQKAEGREAVESAGREACASAA